MNLIGIFGISLFIIWVLFGLIPDIRKDKRDAKYKRGLIELNDTIDALIKELGITPTEIEEARIRLRRNNEIHYRN